MKILIADDNQFYRQLLQTAVRGWGHEVVAVKDGEAAWQLLQARDAPCVAIVDWMMPGMNGLELCSNVRGLNRERPTYIIIVTVKDSREDILAALNSGADDYVCKPFDCDELKARLQVGMRIVGLQSGLADRVGVLETALFQAQKIEAIGRLAGGIAHDFNNLLTVILGSTEYLQQTAALDQGSAQFLQLVRDAATQGASLTRQLLAFARKQVLNPIVLDLNASVANVEKLLRRLLGEDIRVVRNLEPELWPVEADPGQYEQVLMNLLINARDAMPNGGTLTISSRNIEIDAALAPSHPGVPVGEYAVVSVADTGCGMDENTRSRLFEPFFTTKDKGKGTGLGLATVYGIVRQSGGYIHIESELGRGANFQVYLPRSLQRPTCPVPEERPMVFSEGKETLLLVEDEDRVRTMLSNILSRHGYNILEAANGEEALSIGRQYVGPVHLLLTDIAMPGINGYETAKRFSALRPGIRVLCMSGYADHACLRDASATRELPLLQKPFSTEALLARVREELSVS